VRSAPIWRKAASSDVTPICHSGRYAAQDNHQIPRLAGPEAIREAGARFPGPSRWGELASDSDASAQGPFRTNRASCERRDRQMECVEWSGPSVDCSLQQGYGTRSAPILAEPRSKMVPTGGHRECRRILQRGARPAMCAEASSRELQPSPPSPSARNQAAIPVNLTVHPSTEPRTRVVVRPAIPASSPPGREVTLKRYVRP
jgi:hypothetical protein